MDNKELAELDRVRKIIKKEKARERAKAMGGNYIGQTDVAVGEYLPTSADKPITVGGRIIK